MADDFLKRRVYDVISTGGASSVDRLSRILKERSTSIIGACASLVDDGLLERGGNRLGVFYQLPPEARKG